MSVQGTPETARRCELCDRPLVGGWIERPGRRPICLGCGSVEMARELRAAAGVRSVGLAAKAAARRGTP